MITTSESIAEQDISLADMEPARKHAAEEEGSLISSLHTTVSPLLSRGKFISHHPKAGVNPLVDAAASLFSMVGRLKQMRSFRHLNKLQKELISEINAFQEVAKAYGYSSEYILVSRYALCATFDDVIATTLWGSQGQWDNYSLLAAFNQESAQQERFFIILERLIKDPGLYIELMEFMYLCLSLGFKGNYRSTEFGNNQFEQICNALYKRIRLHQGDVTRALSPFPIKPTLSLIRPKPQKKPAIGFAMITTACIILAVFIGLGFLLDTITNQTYQELLHIGKSLVYEADNT
ncbi:MAG TPA: type IVB secretion system protein IcmH/DotU [Gammaproteobacteria bacterium]|nr:type IVB secretion system protein IcmH/DotU [Gammaproteobacteria bacterium]